MARIAGADPKKQTWISGLFTRIVYGMTRRKLGRSVAPVEIIAHHSRILLGYGQMEQSLAGSTLVDGTLKHLAEIRVATLVGCPFWIDIGSAVSRAAGVSEEKIRDLQDFRTSGEFSESERLVLEYADQLTQTPVEVDETLFESLRAKFNAAQLVELTATIAWENYRARFNHAFGAESENFSTGAVCAVPARLSPS
jgi:alkylhydroperoxidase family enzyme